MRSPGSSYRRCRDQRRTSLARHRSRPRHSLCLPPRAHKADCQYRQHEDIARADASALSGHTRNQGHDHLTSKFHCGLEMRAKTSEGPPQHLVACFRPLANVLPFLYFADWPGFGAVASTSSAMSSML